MKVYKLDINSNDETGMNAIALVKKPAVEVDFLAFEKMESVKLSEEKREITGVVCMADVPIYRNTPQMGEHYILFTKELIKSMILKYFKLGMNNNVNIEHQGDLISGLTMIESYIKDSERNISPIEFSDVPDGSWIATFKVENDEVWNNVKNLKTLKGFSLEGLFNYGQEIEMSKEPTYDEWIEEIINNINA